LHRDCPVSRNPFANGLLSIFNFVIRSFCYGLNKKIRNKFTAYEQFLMLTANLKFCVTYWLWCKKPPIRIIKDNLFFGFILYKVYRLYHQLLWFTWAY
jgi:hypothetical protein